MGEAYACADAGWGGGPYEGVNGRGVLDDRRERGGDNVRVLTPRKHIHGFFGRDISAGELYCG